MDRILRLHALRALLLAVLLAAPALASAQTMSFEDAGAMLGASCGKDIDDNCRGVNLDPTRLKDCLFAIRTWFRRSARRTTRKSSARSSSARRRARASSRSAQRDAAKLCGGGAEGRDAAMPRVGQARRQHPMHQDHRRRGVPLMHPANPLRDAGLLAALLIMLAAPACPALAQATAPAENLVEPLAGLETAPELDTRRAAPAGDRALQIEGDGAAIEPAAARPRTAQAAADQRRRAVRSGFLHHPAGLVSNAGTHRRRAHRSGAAAVQVPDRRPHRIGRQARPQCDRQPAAGRRHPRYAGDDVQDIAQARSVARSGRRATAGRGSRDGGGQPAHPGRDRLEKCRSRPRAPLLHRRKNRRHREKTVVAKVASTRAPDAAQRGALAARCAAEPGPSMLTVPDLQSAMQNPTSRREMVSTIGLAKIRRNATLSGIKDAANGACQSVRHSTG